MNKEKVEQLGASFGVAVAEATEALAEIVKEALAGHSLTLPPTVAPGAEVESAAEEAPKKAPRKRTTRAKKTEAEAPKAEAPKAEAPKAESPKAEAPKAEAPKAEAPKAEAPKAEAPKSDIVAGDVTLDELRQVGSKLLNIVGKDGPKVLSQIVGTIILPDGTPAPNLSSVPVTEYSKLMGLFKEGIAKYDANPLG